MNAFLGFMLSRERSTKFCRALLELAVGCDCVYKFNGNTDLHSLTLIKCPVSNKQAKFMEKPKIESENVELGVAVKTSSCAPHP